MKVLKEILTYVLIILIVILIRSFIVTPVRVSGASMNPTLKNGQILILNKLDRKFRRMDIVVFDYNNERLIKRVIGLPGERVNIKDNKLYINEKEVDDYSSSVETKDYDLDITIPEDYYFVLGDNRGNSIDSRLIGLVSKADIVGTINIRLLPFRTF